MQFKRLVLHLCLEVVFLSKRQFFQEIVFNLMEKTKQKHVVPKLIDCIFTTCIFNLWMSKGGMIYLFSSLISWDMIESPKK